VGRTSFALSTVGWGSWVNEFLELGLGFSDCALWCFPSIPWIGVSARHRGELPAFSFAKLSFALTYSLRCVIRGCVPKKLFVYASQFSADFADSKGFGWDMGGAPTMSWDFMMANKTKEVQRLNGVYERMLSSAGVTMLQGCGSLVDAHTVKVRVFCEARSHLLFSPSLMR